MKITKRQLRRIIREELKIAKTEKLNEALRVQQRPPRTAGGGPEAYEYVLWDTSYQREVSIGTAEAVQQLIKNLQQALRVPVETLPEAGK